MRFCRRKSLFLRFNTSEPPVNRQPVGRLGSPPRALGGCCFIEIATVRLWGLLPPDEGPYQHDRRALQAKGPSRPCSDPRREPSEAN